MLAQVVGSGWQLVWIMVAFASRCRCLNITAHVTDFQLDHVISQAAY